MLLRIILIMYGAWHFIIVWPSWTSIDFDQADMLSVYKYVLIKS